MHIIYIFYFSSNIFSKYLGESEASIRKVFKQARQLTPCIIFIDNIESIGTKRGSDSGDSGVQERVLSTLLNEMDGIEANNGVFFISTSSNIDNVDEALLRPGRLEIIIKIKPANMDALHTISCDILGKLKVDTSVSVIDLIKELKRVDQYITISEVKRVCSNVLY